MSKPAPISIFKLTPGSFVELDLNGKYVERAMFLGVEGEGAERRARFITHVTTGKGYYEWDAYRTNDDKRWAFGSSAERISVVSILG